MKFLEFVTWPYYSPYLDNEIEQKMQLSTTMVVNADSINYFEIRQALGDNKNDMFFTYLNVILSQSKTSVSVAVKKDPETDSYTNNQKYQIKASGYEFTEPFPVKKVSKPPLFEIPNSRLKSEPKIGMDLDIFKKIVLDTDVENCEEIFNKCREKMYSEYLKMVRYSQTITRILMWHDDVCIYIPAAFNHYEIKFKIPTHGKMGAMTSYIIPDASQPGDIDELAIIE